MSVDYYLVCRKSKTVMPAFSFVTLGGGWVPDKRWFEKFVYAMDDGAELLHEDSDDMPDWHEDKNWNFINAWHEFEEEKL